MRHPASRNAFQLVYKAHAYIYIYQTLCHAEIGTIGTYVLHTAHRQRRFEHSAGPPLTISAARTLAVWIVCGYVH